MKKQPAVILFIICAVCFAAYYRAAQGKQIESASGERGTAPLSEISPQSIQAAAFGVSGNVSDIAPIAKRASSGKQTRVLAERENFRKAMPNAVHDADARIAEVSQAQMPSPSLAFNGISNRQNFDAYGYAVVPPDANGDVGPNHFVQSVNILTSIFNKNGSPLTNPFKLSDIFGVLNTPCSQENDGSPTALYDPLADRWILSQYCNLAPPFRQMIAVSKTGDPTGAYYVYEFVMPNIKLNDYSKFGVWTDGYYMSDDQFIGNDYAGSGVFAFDKKKMLTGDPTASYVYFDLASPSTIRMGGFLPSDVDGLTAPPAGAPNTFATYTATEYGDANDALRLFDFHADFANPQNSTFTERAESPLVVAPFDPTSSEGRSDVYQPLPGDVLDAQSDRLMYRLAYRNFGAAGESLVVNQTVRVTPVNDIYRAGVRLYELRKSNNAYAVREQATIGDNALSRWIGSAAQDYQGNLAVGYSVASENEKPDIYYTGKLASEPTGVFRAEASLIKGTGVQEGFGSRWGDYSQMTVDPSDDCTFWLTNEYYSAESQAESPFGWLTYIGKFKFPECAGAPKAIINGAILNAANNQPIAGALVTANAVYSRSTNANGSYGDFTLVPNTYTLTATADGFRSQSITVTLIDGQTLTQNFALEPTAIISQSSYEIASESCAINGAIDPGETVTVNIALRNTGARNTTNLTATLLSVGGVTGAGAAQNYGALDAGGATVSRSFTFTASPNLVCGAAINLTLQLSDSTENLGTIVLILNAGAPRVAFSENFDSVVAPNLPAGWHSSASGAQDVWKTSETHFQSAPNAAYSYDAAQVGVNELVSPFFQITSPNAELTFRNRYDLETTFLRNRRYDGSVLEIKIGRTGRFKDTLAAGGAFESGGYDGAIDTCCQNPLAGRLGWSGKSGINQTPEFITTKVRFPASAAGKYVQLRWRVGTDIGTFREGQYIDDITVSDGFVCACQTARTNNAPFDFDGDGKTDLSVFNANDNGGAPDFRIQNSRDNSIVEKAWGSIGDVAAAADYDGDGKTDLAVFRPANAVWFILRSSDNLFFTARFGLGTDKIAPADFDGDGQADLAVFRQSTGVWYVRQSSDNQIRAVQFGQAGDLPVQSDYDGDGKTDLAIYRSGAWYVRQSSDGALTSVQFGQAADKPVAGDFDGDGKADFVVFRPSNGTWYSLESTAGFSAVQFGASGDTPLQADFDGDGRRDIAVYRLSAGVWYYLKSADGSLAFRQFGAGVDVALPSIFVP